MPPSRRASAPVVACFGEALWDVLPRGIFLGGAPLNVAYHLSRHDIRPWMVTAIGCDFLGDEVVRRVQTWGLSTRGIARDPRRPTGTVQATLDRNGAAKFTIARGVAWDAIPFPKALRARPAPVALVFGTLALRTASNRETLARLLTKWPRAVRVLDLNLRPPFDAPPAVEFALRHTQLLKLNDTELARLTGQPTRTLPALERATRRLATTRSISRVCVTAGPRGAGLWWDGMWHWEHGRHVVVRDTVGAGDAFLGTLLANVLGRQAPPPRALALACRVGEYVAAQDGATPSYSIGRNGLPAA
jgi:fructokinase